MAPKVLDIRVGILRRFDGTLSAVSNICGAQWLTLVLDGAQNLPVMKLDDEVCGKGQQKVNMLHEAVLCKACQAQST